MTTYKVRKGKEGGKIYTKDFSVNLSEITQEQIQTLMQQYVLHHAAKTHPTFEIVEGETRAARNLKVEAPKPPKKEKNVKNKKQEPTTEKNTIEEK